MFLFYSISSISATLDIKDEDFITMNKDYLTITIKNTKVADYLEFEKNNDIEYIIPSDSIINMNFKYEKYLQTQNSGANLKGSLSDFKTIDEAELILGRLPSKEYEIVVDKMVLENMINNYSTNTAGYFEINDFLDKFVYINNLEKFTIVGITDSNEPNIYTHQSLFVNMIQNSSKDYYRYYEDVDTANSILDYEIVINNKVKLVEGNLPINDYEVIVNELYKNEIELNKKIDLVVNNKKLKVVGYYKNLEDNNYQIPLTNNNTVKYDLITKANNLSVYTKNKDEVLNYFYDKKINIKNSYEYSKANYLEEQSDSIINTLIVSGVILGISLIEILLMIRSSFLSRIKEVGIYRAIGVKKSDIYKMFAGEIFSITIIASFTGISFMTYILYNLSKINYLSTMFMVNIPIYLISLLLILIFNLIVGLLPVYNTIRKTPAEILSRFDVD